MSVSSFRLGIAYGILLVLLITGGVALWVGTRAPAATTVDTRLESGIHVTFVFVASQVAMGEDPDPGLVRIVSMARDSVRSAAQAANVRYSTVGVSDHWVVSEGIRTLEAFGPFDEVVVGRSWFNSGVLRYMSEEPKGFPAVIITVEDITVGQSSWTSNGISEARRLLGRRALEAWGASGFPLELEGLVGSSPVASPEAGGPPIWRLAAEPVLSAGDSERKPLHDVRGAAILTNHLVLAERSTATLQFLPLAGDDAKTLGGIGEGPGEFADLAWMYRAGEDFVVYDDDMLEIATYSSDGTELGNVRLQPEEGFPGVVALGMFSDGTVLAASHGGPFAPDKPGVSRFPLDLVRYGTNGKLVRSLAVVPSSESYYEPWGRSGVRTLFRVFGRTTGIAVLDTHYAVLDNDSHDIMLYTRDGVESRLLRPEPVPDPVPFAGREAERARNELLESARWSTRDELSRMVRAMGLPDQLPPYGWPTLGRIRAPLVAADGLLWALRYGGVPVDGIDEEGAGWFVFDPDLGHVATLVSDEEVELLDVNAELAVVLRRRELGQQVVELRRIQNRY